MKQKVYYRKLIRDKVPEYITASGDTYETRVMEDEEYIKELKRKLIEEAKEVAKANPDEVAEELADILEVIKAITKHHRNKFSVIEKLQTVKRKNRGGFRKKLFLKWVTQK